MRVRDYKGKLVDAPADLYQHVAVYADGFIVWSRRGKLHQVRYGLQVNQYNNSMAAAKCFGFSVRHYAESDGLLDYELDP